MKPIINDVNLQDYKAIIHKLRYGKKNAITRKQLYLDYRNIEKGTLSFDSYDRQIRALVEQARLHGWKIIGDNNGMYIAETDQEWEDYMKKVESRISSEIQTFAGANKTTPMKLVRNWLLEKKEIGEEEQQFKFGFE